MENQAYKKIAGTSAVFIFADYHKASPVERDGMTWSAAELHLETLPASKHIKPAMATVLALEGLEDYDPPDNGDVRHVDAIATDFVYVAEARAWLQFLLHACNQ